MQEQCWGKQLWAVFLFVFIVLPGTEIWASSHIAGFVFVTDPQTVLVGQNSQQLTVQARDALGNPVEAGETMDLEFSSSSPTGVFSNSSGNPASTVMNRNWKSRTFYYRDSAVGTYNLKIKATGRDSGKSLEAAQEISISSGQSAPAPLPEPIPSSSVAAPSPAPSASDLRSAPAPPPAETASPAAQLAPGAETSWAPPGVREEEQTATIATETRQETPLIVPVQVLAAPPPPPESPKPVPAPQAQVGPESLPIALAAAPASAVVAAIPAGDPSSPTLFFMLAFGLSSITAVGFLAIKSFLQVRERSNG